MAGRPQRRYKDEQITLALTCLVKNSDSFKHTTEELERDHDLRVPRKTIANWRDNVHNERYREIRRAFHDETEQRLIGKLFTTAEESGDVALEAVRRAREMLPFDEDPSRTAANLSKVQTGSIEKGLTLQGRPSVIEERRTVEASVQFLIKRGYMHGSLEPEEDEVVDAVVVDDDG